MFPVHDDGSFDVLYHDVRILWSVGNVRYRLQDAEQQQNNEDSEHPDYHVQPLLWRECIKPFLDVLDDREVPYLEAVGVVVRAAGVHQSALRHQRPLRHVTLTDDRLLCERSHPIRVAVEVAHHAVHPHRLVDVARDDAVIKSLFREVTVVVVGALVGHHQRTLHVALYGTLLRCQREEQFVEASDVFPRLCRTVLRQVLRECQHQRLAAVEHIDLLALLLREAVRTPHRPHRNHRTRGQEDHPEQPKLPE